MPPRMSKFDAHLPDPCRERQSSVSGECKHLTCTSCERRDVAEENKEEQDNIQRQRKAFGARVVEQE